MNTKKVLRELLDIRTKVEAKSNILKDWDWTEISSRAVEKAYEFNKDEYIHVRLHDKEDKRDSYIMFMIHDNSILDKYKKEIVSMFSDLGFKIGKPDWNIKDALILYSKKFKKDPDENIYVQRTLDPQELKDMKIIDGRIIKLFKKLKKAV